MNQERYIEKFKFVNKCCENSIWRTDSFPILRKELTNYSESLEIGICETCDNFFIAESDTLERV